jgi:hypothetical protein
MDCTGTSFPPILFHSCGDCGIRGRELGAKSFPSIPQHRHDHSGSDDERFMDAQQRPAALHFGSIARSSRSKKTSSRPLSNLTT